jgi:hypothetical protein
LRDILLSSGAKQHYCQHREVTPKRERNGRSGFLLLYGARNILTGGSMVKLVGARAPDPLKPGMV